jgi:L-2-hydroxyglutarate oxidase LhgO
MRDAQVGVIGAGVVGLACAAVLARRGRSVILVERNARAGLETSSRNSGVVHAGLYYPCGSVKARTCAIGRTLLYDRCRRLGIPHLKCGKIVVAVEPAEVETLESIYTRGVANGAEKLQLLDQRQLTRLEPEVRAQAALWSPDTGIVDAHALMRSYAIEAKEKDALVAFRAELTGLHLETGGWRIDLRSANRESESIRVQAVINAAGLESERVASYAGLKTKALGYKLHYCKGDYFSLAPSLRAIVRHLVYPVPVSAGLGIHLTFDLGEKFFAGPDTEYVTEPSYGIDSEKAALFSAAIHRYLPRIKPEHLSPDYAGVRPKLQGPGETFRDFVIEEASAHGAPGLINLIGIESPGLTASEAIALEVERLVASVID